MKKKTDKAIESLGTIVSTKAAIKIKNVIILTAFISFIIIFAILIKRTQDTCADTAKLYVAQIEKNMKEKISFLDTIASSINSGAVNSDQYYDYVDEMVAKYTDVSAVYICVPEPDSIYPDGINTYMSGGWVPKEDFVVTDRAWFQGALKNSGINISEPYIDEQSKNICITLSHAVSTPYGDGAVGLDMYMSDLVSLAESSYQDGNYISIVTGTGTILTHPNPKYALSESSAVNISDTPYEKSYRHMGKNKLLLDYSGGIKSMFTVKSDMLNWCIVYVDSLAATIFLILAFIAIITGMVMIVTKISINSLLATINPLFQPLEEVSSNISNITEGNLGFSFTVDNQSSELSMVTHSLNATMESFRYYINEISHTVEMIADKDLSQEVTGDYQGDYCKIKDSLVHILDVLKTSFIDINEQAETVREFADNLTQTSEHVAKSVTNQNYSVMSVNAEVSNLAKSVNDITKLADSVQQNVKDTNEQLTTGGEEMIKLVDAMNEIVNCFDGIAGFVSEINKIASQTNLLSLNASIEAARAGESGRGFAVVAGEIQNLSIDSTNASNNISDLIQKSKIAVDRGKELVEKTQNTIKDGIEYSISNAENIHKIVEAISTQKNSIDGISKDFKDISEIVESNAATAEENSAIAIQLGDCAKKLSGTVNEYKIK